MLQDLRRAARLLVRNRLFTLSAVVTLALGIGVNGTIFTIANSLLFRPLRGIASPVSLMWLSSVSQTRPRPAGLSYPDYEDYRARSSDVFAECLAYAPTPFSLAGDGEPQRVRGHLVTGSYFATLGTVPALGRLLGPSDDRPSATPVAVLGNELWRERFGGVADVLDRTIVINGQRFVVAGVAPRGFTGPELGQAADLWVTIATLPLINTAQAAWLDERGTAWLRVIGRLRPGRTVEDARLRVATVAASLEPLSPTLDRGRTAVVTPMSSGLSPSDRGEVLPITALLLLTTGLVLLIACANVANLLLARGAGRLREFSIRAAIGASRRQLVRQLLAESVLLAVAASITGLLSASWASDLLVSFMSADFRGLDAAVDLRVLAFTGGLGIASVILFGLAPALTSTRNALVLRLHETSGAGGGRSRLQGAFVVTELALSLVLLLAAGLSLRALQKSASVDLGFNPRQLVTASYDLVLQNYPAERRVAFRRELRARFEAVPGVESVTLANVAPLMGTMIGSIAGASDRSGHPRQAHTFLNAVGPRYFETLQIPIVKGRALLPSDTRSAPDAAVINQTLARELWPDGDPVGQTLRIDDRPVLVVGVARDAKYNESTERPSGFAYLSLDQHSELDREAVIARTATGLTSAGAAIQSTVRALDPTLPTFDVRSFDTVLRDRADKQRGVSTLLAAFGALALVLAALGLYAVMAYTVTRRTRELGVRLALGATPSQLTTLVARESLRLALAGVAIGAVLGWPLARLLGALVFGIQIGDLAAFAGSCILLIGVAIAAALVPARRAGRLDPIAALRCE